MAGSVSKPPNCNAVRCQLEMGELLHKTLDEYDLLNQNWKPMRKRDSLIFPLKSGLKDEQLRVLKDLSFEIHLTYQKFVQAELSNNPHAQLRRTVSDWLHGSSNAEEINVLLSQLPQKWERYGDMIVLPERAFESDDWVGLLNRCSESQLKSFWQCVTEALSGRRLARQHPIAKDTFRSSQTELLYGENGWVEFRDHGIRFGFDATQVMFSSGNNTERRRIGNIPMDGEVVVDAYAGVGYYTLHMAYRSKAMHVHAFEMNPHSIEGLQWAIKANHLENKITVHHGDNQLLLPNVYAQADRCHLGLLPSSENAWEHSILCLKPTGGWLHIHMNVQEKDIESWRLITLEKLRVLAEKHGRKWSIESHHLEKVKWFSPRVRHVVLDVYCQSRNA
ncbi:MAG: hypothetical protein DWC09_08165 [Candidatus Poseidoniales archaeon]|nr:MAG: hypothetical protein DWC09_08165 [Candidatus Poseidoniales archaeon]